MGVTFTVVGKPLEACTVCFYDTYFILLIATAAAYLGIDTQPIGRHNSMG